jgi:two-component system response regulator NreC
LIWENFHSVATDEHDPNQDLINLERPKIKAMPITLLLVEDHPVVRTGLRMLVESASDIDIVGEADTATKAIELAHRLKPDVVLMDISLPDGSGIKTTEEIKVRYPEMVVVALTIHEDREYVDRMISVGANDYVSKSAAPEELLKAIRKGVQGRVSVFPAKKT